MTPKEKAIELVGKFAMVNSENYIDEDSGLWETDFSLTDDDAIKCALIAVDEIINECYMWHGGDYIEWDIKRFKYWQEVKQEIEKL